MFRAQPQASLQPTLAQEIVFYNWEGDLPEEILQAFEKETGVHVVYEIYEAQEDALENIRSGEVYDLVVLENRFIPIAAGEGLLAELNHAALPNFKNVSPAFRDLIYDPGNRFSAPYNYGVTALVVRSDLAAAPVTRWSDLWRPEFTGKAAIWYGLPRDTLAFTLKSLGYSGNSEDEDQLERALEQLIALEPLRLEAYDLETAAPALASGDIALCVGYAGDVLASRKAGLDVAFVLPAEGALLWGDTFVIPANSPNKATAEALLNFLMRPDINAEIANQNYYATPNQAAWPLIDPLIYNDPVIFPPQEAMANVEIILPLSAEGQALYDSIWERFEEAQR
jgi:spermidine/putrescine transport system substrate-binding protein